MITGEVFMDIKAMNRDGLSIRRIAKITGLHRKTVKRHLRNRWGLINMSIATATTNTCRAATR